MKTSSDLKQLWKQAVKARTKSHSPYSKVKIGAAVRLANGKIYSGCNIENASYGATVCAERVAIWKAQSENKKIKISEICVVSDRKPAWPPCGLCRQVLAEFANGKTLVHVGGLKGVVESYTLDELLPAAFNPKHLK